MKPQILLWSTLLHSIHCFIVQPGTKNALGKTFLTSNNLQRGEWSPTRTTTSHGISSSALSASSSQTADTECDILILGSGPAARAIASLLSTKLSVVLSDSNADTPWVPNYGAWVKEWDAVRTSFSKFGISFDGCVDRLWNVTDCYFGGSFDIPMEERLRLDKPYIRVGKDALRDALTTDYRIIKGRHRSKAIGVNLYSPPGSLLHDESGSTIRLYLPDDDKEEVVRAKLIVDCTGHETTLILRDQRVPYRMPGFQIAYGALVQVAESSPQDSIGPYDKEAMTLFDYRTDHIPSEKMASAEAAPTFMYAMPLKDNRIFFEETSLVGRPAVSFEVCKERCFQRLKHLGIEVEEIEEEEFCYIPMGGPLPEKNQRIVGFGGASAMVHPSTGYTLCRTLMGAASLADSILDSFESSSFEPEKAAAEAYHSIWSPSNIRQRNFAVFGGEFLMKQNVEGLRGFFDGFFALPMEMWSGFLAGWPGLPDNELHETWRARLWFGLLFVSKLPAKVALDMLASIASYSITDGIALPQSVTPFLGEPESYEYDVRPITFEVGDVAAKAEARDMIRSSKVTKELPVAFDADGDSAAKADSGSSEKKASDASGSSEKKVSTASGSSEKKVSAAESSEKKVSNASESSEKKVSAAESSEKKVSATSSSSSPAEESFQ